MAKTAKAVTSVCTGSLVLGAAWIFSGRHRFEVTAVEGQTRLEQSERFGGLLLPLLWRTFDKDTRRGFEAMNVALAAEVARREGARRDAQ